MAAGSGCCSFHSHDAGDGICGFGRQALWAALSSIILVRRGWGGQAVRPHRDRPPLQGCGQEMI